MQLIDPAEFCSALDRSGFGFFTGVPDSLLKDFLLHVRNSYPAEMHVITANEGNAVALASGHYLATGKPGIVYMQNSGLGYSLNAFTSLTLIYKIPMLVIMSWRGKDGKDAPEHIIMGDIDRQLLETAGMEFSVLSEENCEEVIKKAKQKIYKEKLPYTLIVEKGLFDERH